MSEEKKYLLTTLDIQTLNKMHSNYNKLAFLKSHEYKRRTCFNMADRIDDLNPVDGVKCVHFGYAFRVDGLDEEDGYILSNDVFECDPSYCPNCGARVVEE